MNHERVIKELREKYPSGRIVPSCEEEATEIFCELDPLTKGADKRRVAITVVDKTSSHKHIRAIETYEVLEGVLRLTVNGKEEVLQAGGFKVIASGQVHSAQGNETWVRLSAFNWSPQDYVSVVSPNNT